MRRDHFIVKLRYIKLHLGDKFSAKGKGSLLPGRLGAFADGSR
jgi:hypothetical protein